MRKSGLILLLFCGFAEFVLSQAADDEKRVQGVIIETFRGIALSDAGLIKSGCTNDIIILEDGIVWNMDSLLSKVILNKHGDYKRTNTIEFVETSITGNSAYVIYRNRADVTRNGQSVMIRWMESAYLINRDGRWKIKSLHSTTLERVKNK